MRQPAGVLSSEEIARLKHEAEAELEGQRAVAQARKEKMLKVCHATMVLPLHSPIFYNSWCNVLTHFDACFQQHPVHQIMLSVLDVIHFDALIC